jgi:hypothetical protein
MSRSFTWQHFKAPVYGWTRIVTVELSGREKMQGIFGSYFDRIKYLFVCNPLGISRSTDNPLTKEN